MSAQISLILTIIAELLKDIIGGKIGAITSAAIRIAQAANLMHLEQEGKPIDPSLLSPEQPIT